MPVGSVAGVVTSLLVERWDNDQVRYVLGRLGVPYNPARNYTITPRTFREHAVAPYQVTRDENCNQIIQAGWVALLGGIAGTSIATKFSGTAGRIGIGTSTAATSYTQTALTADTGGSSTTSYYQLVSAAPAIVTVSSPPTLTLTATFGTGVANFAWQEFGTDNYTASGVTTAGTGSVFINRGLSSQGTKSSGLIWAITEILAFGVPTAAGAVS